MLQTAGQEHNRFKSAGSCSARPSLEVVCKQLEGDFDLYACRCCEALGQQDVKHCEQRHGLQRIGWHICSNSGEAVYGKGSGLHEPEGKDEGKDGDGDNAVETFEDLAAV